MALENNLEQVMLDYQSSFSGKIYEDIFLDSDVLMEAFGITQELKSENKQYWGRELGMCWQHLLDELFRTQCKNYLPAIRIDQDEPCDFVVDNDAIDAKYRVGSGDSGTSKKFKSNGELLISKGYKPTMLILRTDNLKSTIQAAEKGGWKIIEGNESFDYILEKTNFDLKKWLIEQANSKKLIIKRS